MNFLAWTNKSKNLAQTHQNFVLLHDGVTVKFRNSDTATIHNTQCTVPITQYTVYSAQYKIHCVQGTSNIVHSTVHNTHCPVHKKKTQCTVHNTQCTVQYSSHFSIHKQLTVQNIQYIWNNMLRDKESTTVRPIVM